VVAHGAAGGGGGAGDNGSHCFFPCIFCFFFSSSFFFFFLSRFSPLYPYSAPLFFLSIPIFLSCSPFPCFYRQKTGERENGAATVLRPLHRPSNTWKALGCVSVFLKGSQRLFEGEDGGNRGRKNLLLPLFRASRGRRRPTVPFKTAPFGSFFLMNSV